MKKFIWILLLILLVVGCISIKDDNSIISSIEQSKMPGYKYCYRIQCSIGTGVYYTNDEFKIGDKVKFVKVEK